MKLLIIALVFVSNLTTKALANAYEVPSPVMISFQSEFPEAQNVEWKQSNHFSIATFTTDGNQFHAFYDVNGYFVVLAQDINMLQLPKELLRNFNEKFSGYKPLAVYKMEGDDGIRYYCEAENNGKKYVISSDRSVWNVLVQEK